MHSKSVSVVLSYQMCQTMIIAFQYAIDMQGTDEVLSGMRQTVLDEIGACSGGFLDCVISVDQKWIDDAVIVLGMMSAYYEKMPPLTLQNFSAVRQRLQGAMYD
ncbi:hypothetical protein [Oceanobacter sp. 3_MG-2023]|uniref:hypothetical protein n=1 Tax=Oceanobacter sp. 3_MG-2023 TaxID=3062622 RepID=UPI00273237EC|nr:hypothetical protein [Oceanobacter sp. 3_MG-2023]MDP2505633.1 hypothetical protein [Oceanobacter sp. 3_MG-2023]